MWSIKAHSKKDFLLSIDADDIVFVAVLKRGPLVHKHDDSLFRCHHIAEYEDGVNLSFNMTILNATSVSLDYPEFISTGIMGRWKLISPKSNTNIPTIILIEHYSSANEFINDAISETNPTWIKKSYTKILSH